jgi:hypothetical protein
MPLAQVIRFDERQPMGRPRRHSSQPSTCVILYLNQSRARRAALPLVQGIIADDDRAAGRGRDPG